jgi:hypothetical protein
VKIEEKGVSMSIKEGNEVVEMSAEQVAEKAEQDAYIAEMAQQDFSEDAPAPVAETEPQVEPEAIEPVVERKEIFKGYTEEELGSALAMLPKLQKSLDTTNGTFGSRLADQQRIIEQLQQQRVGSLSPDKLKRLSQEFPEIAEMLAEDLNDVMGSGGQGFDAAQVDQYVNPKVQALEDRIEQKERALELRSLNRNHRDWREVAAFEPMQDGRVNWKNPAFGQWVNGQPEDVRQQLISGWDADFISDKLTEFKEATKPKAVKKQSLESAIIPRGVQGRAISTETDEEEAAYRAEMARR